MPAQQRIIANHANRVASAVISVTNQRPAGDPRLTALSRAGRGTMALVGPYTGATDKTVEIEILEGTGTELRPSSPVNVGVGNGQLTVTGLDASATPETVTFRLSSTGTAGQRAALEFFGVTLVARVEGTPGNAVELTVERRLTLSDPVGATLADLSAGSATLPDARWDFGAVAATDSGIPASAPRIQFERFEQVHRHWKAWVDNAWVYKIDPAPAYAIPTDTPVRAVTGDYQITITDGTTIEVYDAVTHYDFLSQVRATSTLIEVVGTVTRDTATGGQAVTDIQLRTDAYTLPPVAAISGRYGSRVLDDVAVLNPAAVTENIQITRRAGRDGVAGWSVNGAASGSYPDALMGVPYSGGPVGFTIPAAEVPTEALGLITSRVDFASRTPEQEYPAICVKRLTAGAAATAKTVTFRYTRRPLSSCDCESLSAPPLSQSCLGLTGGPNDMALDPVYQDRLAALYDWRATFFDTQSDFSSPDDARAAVYDMDLCDQAVTAFADTIAQVYSVTDAVTAWTAELGRMQTEFNALAGLAVEAVPPTYLTGTDISVVYSVLVGANYIANGKVYKLLNTFEEYDRWAGTSVACGASISDTQWTTSLITKAQLPDTSTWPSAGVFVLCTTQSVNAPVAGDPPISYGVFSKWEYLGNDGDIVSPGTPAGEGGDLKNPEISDYNDVTGETGPASWYSRATEQLVRKYTARMDAVLVIAGIVPKTGASSGCGDRCWQDDEEAGYWWADTSGYYLPAFSGVPYVSSVKDGDCPISTEEFGFVPMLDCDNLALEGDSIVITIRGNSQSGAYQEGDRFTIPVIAAAPAPLTGGEDGDSIHTWIVEGSEGGRYPDWLWQASSPTAYAGGPLDATLAPGGIPFESGDEIRVALEGGRLRWRKDGSTWTEADLFNIDQDLGDGLTLNAVQAYAPSFITGDTWTYLAEATYGLDRLRQPRDTQAFAFDGSSTQIDIDLGAERAIDLCLIALHSLPETASVTLSGGLSDTTDWSTPITWRSGPMLAAPADTARYLRLSITGAGTGAEIGWLWLGTPWTPSNGVSSLTHVHQYGLTRGAGRNPGALYRGRGTGGRWSWALDSGSLLTPTDITGLTEILDHVAQNGLEWVCLVPAIDRTETATLAQIDADEVTITEHLGYALDGDTASSAELPFRAVLR